MSLFKNHIKVIFNSLIKLLFFGISFVSVAQESIRFETKALIVKINTNSEWALNKDSIALYTQPHLVESILQLHPTAQAPLKKNDIDLRTIYKITFQDDLQKIDDIVLQLMGTNRYEYVEKIQVQSLSPFYVPNDPAAQPGATMKYLDRMMAYQAWDIEKGDSTVIIGIIDTGFDLLHEETINNVAKNENDPINGIDDDADGYIDNYTGWDLANNDNNPTNNTGSTHGVEVSGVAAARGDNNKGIIGSGFKCKFLPIKASPDGSAGISAGYQGIIYAADHNCKIINISWGGVGAYSQYSQDIINYAAINRDVVIVAAAGNTDEINDYYPAAYDNVLSVAAADTLFSTNSNKYIDTRASFTNWPCCFKATLSHKTDIAAQGMNVRTIRPSNTYRSMDGSSFAAPMVSGAAALLRSYKKNLSALQVIEQLRVTADVFDNEIENTPFKELLGKGRLNMYRALSEWHHPSVRVKKAVYSNTMNSTAISGDSLKISLDLFNYLSTTNELYVTIGTSSNFVHWKDTLIYIGLIDSLMEKKNIFFTAYLENTLPKNASIEFRIGLIDSTKNYFDYQYISTTLNPEYINLTNDYTLLTIPSNGKLGYQDTNSSLGNGYQINNQSSELFEAGLILSTQNNKVSSTFRSSPNGSFTNDFKNISYPTYLHPSFAHQYTQTVFNDSSPSNSDPIGITVQQNAFTLQSNLYKHSIFIHLKLINNTTQTLDSIYAGYFLDFDIGNYVNNQSKYDTSLSLAYVYDVPGASKYYGFVKLTNQEVNIFAMDNSNVGGNNINPNDGFTNSEQFTASTSKLGRAQAGMGSALGNDVSMIYTLKSNKKLLPNDTTHVAFALLRANSLNELRTYAQAAIDTFKSIYTSQVPDEALIETCNATPLTISPSPGNTFQFYTETPDASSIPFLTGASYTYPSYIAKDTVYVTCIDNIFPSAVSKIILSDENCLPASNQNATNDQAFIIAPNPSTDFIQILANTQNIQSPMSVAIINSIGTTVYETNILQPSTQSFIPTQSLANGKYILKITTNDKTFVYSFIKSN